MDYNSVREYCYNLQDANNIEAVLTDRPEGVPTIDDLDKLAKWLKENSEEVQVDIRFWASYIKFASTLAAIAVLKYLHSGDESGSPFPEKNLKIYRQLSSNAYYWVQDCLR